MTISRFDPTEALALRDIRNVMLDTSGACGCCHRADPATLAPEDPVGAPGAGATPRTPDASDAAQAAAGVQAGEVYAPLPVAPNVQIADYLETGFWSWFGGGARKFNVGGSGVGANAGVILYNVADLTAAGAFLADQAFAVYERVLGIDFVKTASQHRDVDIFFYDNDPGASTESIMHPDGGAIDRSYVNISTGWLATYGTSLVSYSFQTYLHEIGHALGLGHAGAYNGFVNFVTDTGDPDYGDNSNIFRNDSWQASMMSYLSQDENTTIGADFAFLLGPMAADWIALGEMYGISPLAFAGDTTWGFNTTISDTVFAALADYADRAAFTVMDGGGVDTLDFSGFEADQRIDLAAEGVSDIGGLVGNMAIGRGVVIENAVGGAGNDVLAGAAGGNDLSGGAGSDTLSGGPGDDTLRGGPGPDAMYGGAGADGYHADRSSDRAVETAPGAAGGFDTVYSSAGFALGSDIEKLVLTGAGAVTGAGNGLGNTIWGNAGVNTLRGLGGPDTIRSGDGGDILIGGLGSDRFQTPLSSASRPGARDILRAGDGAIAFERPGAPLGDRFDFTLFDADATRSEIQGFVFGALTGKGRLWTTTLGDLTLVRGNTDNDAPPELEIAIEDATVLASAYTAADFIL